MSLDSASPGSMLIETVWVMLLCFYVKFNDHNREKSAATSSTVMSVVGCTN